MTTNPKSKCCGANVIIHQRISGYFCAACELPCDLQDQPTSRLDEVAEKYSRGIYSHSSHYGKTHSIKLAIQEYTSDLQQSLTKANEELVELRKDKKRLGQFLFDTVVGEPCDSFEPDCCACQSIQLLKEVGLSAIAAQEKMK